MALLVGVGERRKDAPCPQGDVVTLGAVSCREDPRKGGAHVLIHDDPTIDLSTCVADKPRVGAHPHREHEHVEGNVRTARHMRDPTLEPADRVAQHKVDSMRLEAILHNLRTVVVEDARKHLSAAVAHRD